MIPIQVKAIGNSDNGVFISLVSPDKAYGKTCSILICRRNDERLIKTFV